MKQFGRLLLWLVLLATSAAAEPLDFIGQQVVSAQPAVDTPRKFLAFLKQEGLDPRFHVVVNRGWHNINAKSYSGFATVEGADTELAFGVFIESDKEGRPALVNDWDTSLLIEVIVKDRRTGLKNFWELIGEKTGAKWHYRGNSLDVIADAAEIHLGRQAEFGQRLRCSGCHVGGDLVMKERFPYNDWKPEGVAVPGLTERNINHGSDDVSAANWIFENARSPRHLDEAVEQSLRDYVKALEQQSPETDRQWLRSLLAPLEMNLVSDQNRFGSSATVRIPTSFFVDPRLSGPQADVEVPLAVYNEALGLAQSSFAADETPGLIETDHAFLYPVRSRFDELRIDSLKARGKLDDETIQRLLSVDFTTPIFSPERLALMAKLPDRWETPDQLVTALELLEPVSQRQVEQYLVTLRAKASEPETVLEWLRLADQRRHEIQATQTSSNKRGAILEGGLGSEGFRRIFPAYGGFMTRPGQWVLDPHTGQLRARN